MLGKAVNQALVDGQAVGIAVTIRSHGLPANSSSSTGAAMSN